MLIATPLLICTFTALPIFLSLLENEPKKLTDRTQSTLLFENNNERDSFVRDGTRMFRVRQNNSLIISPSDDAFESESELEDRCIARWKGAFSECAYARLDDQTPLWNNDEINWFTNELPNKDIHDIEESLKNKVRDVLSDIRPGVPYWQDIIRNRKLHNLTCLEKAIIQNINSSCYPAWVNLSGGHYNLSLRIPDHVDELIEWVEGSWDIAFLSVFRSNFLRPIDDGLFAIEALWDTWECLYLEFREIANREDLILKITELNTKNSNDATDDNLHPLERLKAQKRIDQLQKLVTILNMLIQRDLAPTEFLESGIIDNLKFKHLYSREQVKRDLVQRASNSIENWKQKISNLFSKRWNNNWYEEGQTINEPLYNDEEKEYFIETWGELRSAEQLNEFIREYRCEICSQLDYKYSLEHKKRLAEQLRNLNKFTNELIDDISMGLSPWKDCPKPDVLQQSELQLYIDKAEECNHQNDLHPSARAENKHTNWKNLIIECANIDEQGEELFSNEQRQRLKDIANNSISVQEALEKLTVSEIQKIIGDTGSSASGTNTQGRQWMKIFTLRQRLENSGAKPASTKISKELDDVLKKCANKKYKDKDLFTSGEKERILNLSINASSIADVAEEARNSTGQLMTGLFYREKEQVMNKLVEDINLIIKRLNKIQRIKTLPRPKGLNPKLVITDDMRIRKRAGLEQFDPQERSTYIDAMNTLDALEMDIGCEIEKLSDLSELDLIEQNLRFMEKDCEENNLNVIEKATDKSLNKIRLEITEKYFKYYDGTDICEIKNIIVLNKVFSFLSFLFDKNVKVKRDKDGFNQYLNSSLGNRDKQAIKKTVETIVVRYPNIIRLLSGWLLLSENKLNVDEIKSTDSLFNFNPYKGSRGSSDEISIGLDRSIATIDGALLQWFFDQREKDPKRSLLPPEYNKGINAINVVYGNCNKPLVEYYQSKNKDLFYYGEDPDESLRLSENAITFPGIRFLTGFLSKISNLKHQDDLFVDLRNLIIENLLNIWGVGAGVVYRKFGGWNPAYSAGEIMRSGDRSLYNLDKCLREGIEDCLSPQLKVAAYTFIKGVRYSENMMSSVLTGDLDRAYNSYKKYINKKGKIPESFPVWLEIEDIDLTPGFTKKQKEIVDIYKIRGNFDGNGTEIQNRLNDIQSWYDYALNYEEDLGEEEPEESENSDNSDNEGSNEKNEKESENKKDVDINVRDNWGTIKAPVGASEWVKTFYEVFESKKSGEHIFDAREGSLTRPIIDKLPSMTEWSRIEDELQSIMSIILSGSRFEKDEDLKKKNLSQVEGIKQLVSKLNELIKRRKAPQNFIGKPSSDDWEHLEEDEKVWENAFIETFSKIENNERIFNFPGDDALLTELPKINNTKKLFDELYYHAKEKVKGQLSAEEIDVRMNEIDDLVKKLVEIQKEGNAPLGFKGTLDFEKFFYRTYKDDLENADSVNDS